MNLKFRFEPAKAIIYFRTDDTETTCSFTEAVQQINQLAANLPVINDLTDRAEERIRKGTKEKGLREAVQTYKDAGYNGSFSAFLLDSIYKYALFHNDEVMRIKLKTVSGHIKDQVQPGFEQLRKLLTVFPAGKAPELDGFSLFQPVYAVIINGQVWYCSDFPCNALLLMFRDVLNTTGTAICTCTVCGEIFCGKSGEVCCGDADCKKYLDNSDPFQKKKDLSAISETVAGRVRSIRHELRDICGTEQAVLEFNSFANSKKAYIIEKVKMLRSTDAPAKAIRQLQKEKDTLYDELNEKRKEIIAKYSD